MVHRLANVLPVKVRVMKSIAFLDDDQGIVIGGIDLDLQRAIGLPGRIDRRADDLCTRAQRVRIFDLLIHALRFAGAHRRQPGVDLLVLHDHLAVAQGGPDRIREFDLAGMWFVAMDGGVIGHDFSAQRFEG